jgi:hypothetical protein
VSSFGSGRPGLAAPAGHSFANCWRGVARAGSPDSANAESLDRAGSPDSADAESLDTEDWKAPMIAPLFGFADYWWLYVAFTAVVVVLLGLDLGGFHRMYAPNGLQSAADL